MLLSNVCICCPASAGCHASSTASVTGPCWRGCVRLLLLSAVAVRALLAPTPLACWPSQQPLVHEGLNLAMCLSVERCCKCAWCPPALSWMLPWFPSFTMCVFRAVVHRAHRATALQLHSIFVMLGVLLQSPTADLPEHGMQWGNCVSCC
jgi:hypothetical protein